MKTKKITMATVFVSLLVLMSAIVMIERFGILAGDLTASIDDLPQTYIDKASNEENHQLDSLIIMDESEISQRHTEQMAFILKSMDVGFDKYMVTEDHSDPLPDLKAYKTVVLSTSQLDSLMGHGHLDILFEWVKDGGGLLNLIPNPHSEAIEIYKEPFGISSVKSGGIDVDKIKIVSDFMIGAQDFEYDLEGFSTYAMNVGMDVAIAEGPTIHVIQQETNTPIVWETKYGDGRIVVNNIDMSEKTTRGMLSAEYSLLQDTFAYPVINSSIFFIDDFPAPIPEGQNEYITKYYNMDMRSFFSNVWLPDIMKLSRD